MNHSILIIDDSPVARQMILDTLREALPFRTCYEAGNGTEGFEILQKNRVDVVLCDLEMPGVDGFRLLEMINGVEELRDVPVILLTGHESDEEKIRGLEKGASDYVTKPFSRGELVARIKVQLKIKALQDELRNSNRMLDALSRTDHLTGLSNRRNFMDVLAREFERCRRRDLSLSLVMYDIDHFKKINDTYGHQRGDEVLAAVAALLGRSMRAYDLAARYGGEEFAVILPESGRKEALQVAERLRRKTGELAFGGALETLHLSASLGIATCPDEKILSVDDLILEADSALYRAKREGRDRVVAAP